jgi:hypothetical protein
VAGFESWHKLFPVNPAADLLDGLAIGLTGRFLASHLGQVEPHPGSVHILKADPELVRLRHLQADFVLVVLKW